MGAGDTADNYYKIELQHKKIPATMLSVLKDSNLKRQKQFKIVSAFFRGVQRLQRIGYKVLGFS